MHYLLCQIPLWPAKLPARTTYLHITHLMEGQLHAKACSSTVLLISLITNNSYLGILVVILYLHAMQGGAPHRQGRLDGEHDAFEACVEQ